MKQHFSSTEGKDEILQDIEARIAELFQSKIEAGSQMIQIEDVNYAISVLGKPGDIGNSDNETNRQSEKTQSGRRKLYRDEEHRVLGGICAGLGHYFDIDPAWFRLGFLLSLIFFGTGIFIYLVLWIIVPVATTAEDRMNMKGSPVTISEIEENIRREFGEMKSRFQGMKNDEIRKAKRGKTEAERRARRERASASASERQKKTAAGLTSQTAAHRSTNSFGSLIGEIFYYLLRALLTIAGIALLVLGIILTLGFILSLTAPDTILFFTKWGISSFSLPAIADLIFDSVMQQKLVLLSLILLLGVPLFMLLFNSLRLIIGYKSKVKIISATAGFLWLCGLILAIIIGVKLISGFSEKESVKTESILQIKGNTLYLGINENKIIDLIYEENGGSYTDENDHQHFIFNNVFFKDHDQNLICYGFPQLRFIPSKTDSFSVSIIKMSRGNNLNKARKKAGNIQYNTSVSDSLLMLDNYFMLPERETWRSQKVRVIIAVPEGKSVYFSPEMENIIYDSDLMDSSWNAEMTGQFTMMTQGRLKIYTPALPDTSSLKKAN